MEQLLTNKTFLDSIAERESIFCVPEKNDRYYPIPTPENLSLYEKYRGEAAKLKNVHFLGRLGDYEYYDMDKAVERALSVAEGLIAPGG